MMKAKAHGHILGDTIQKVSHILVVLAYRTAHRTRKFYETQQLPYIPTDSSLPPLLLPILSSSAAPSKWFC